ncbi:MAG: MoaD/ThiS family protein [Bacteroidia bacterium]
MDDKRLKIKCFGQIEDLTGRSEIELDIDRVLCKKDLVEILEKEYSELNNVSYQIAVNQSYVSETSRIESTDEVVLLPPFAGG